MFIPNPQCIDGYTEPRTRTDTLRSFGVYIPPMKKRREAERPSRQSRRLRGAASTTAHGDGDDKSEDSTCSESPSSRKRAKQEPEDDQLRVHSRMQSQILVPYHGHIEEDSSTVRGRLCSPGPIDRNDVGSRVARHRLGDLPHMYNSTPEMAVTPVGSSSSSVGRVEQEGEQPVGQPTSQHDSREPTLDYLDPPSDRAQATAPPVDHPSSSSVVTQESQHILPVEHSPSGVRRAQTAEEQKLRQEEIARLDTSIWWTRMMTS